MLTNYFRLYSWDFAGKVSEKEFLCFLYSCRKWLPIFNLHQNLQNVGTFQTDYLGSVFMFYCSHAGLWLKIIKAVVPPRQLIRQNLDILVEKFKKRHVDSF